MILLIRGIKSSKLFEAHKGGELMLRPCALRFKGNLAPVSRLFATGDIWDNECVQGYDLNPELKPLYNLSCPICKARRDADELVILKNKFFSNIQCKTCNKVSSSTYWRCHCLNLWYKCPVHFKSSQCSSKGGGDETMHRKRKSLLTDAPPTKKSGRGRAL